MEYTLIIGSRSYDLPKKTMTVVEKLDKVSNIDSVKGISLQEKFTVVFNTVSDFVGAENAKEIFGSSDVREVDLTEVTIAMQKIIDAYDKPLNDYESEKSRRKLDALPIEKLVAISKAGANMAGMKK